MKYKLIIFDMDGLMFDTEIMYFNSWKKLEDKYGFTFDIETRNKLTGMNDANIRRELADMLGSEDAANNLRDDVNEYRLDYLKSYETSLKKEGLSELLAYLRENGIRACIASSSNKDKILYLIEKEGIKDYFDFVISGRDFKNSKPDPEIFETAAAMAGVDKSEALVLEDSYNGYLAAKASGIDYLVIHDTSFDKPFEADKEADSLHDVIKYLGK